VTKETFDHAPVVKAWLEEPVWLPPTDTARIAKLVHQTPQQRSWLRALDSRSFQAMFSAVKFIVAGTFLALIGGFLLSGGLAPRTDEQMPPAAQTTSPAPADATSAPESHPPTVAPITTDDVVVPAPADSIVMDPGSGRSVAGWTEIGRASSSLGGRGSLGGMRELQALGDRLVALGSITARRLGGQRDFIFHSSDGMTWVPTTVPGDEPVIRDIAATADSVLAAGLAKVDGERAGRLWSTSDGIEWAQIDAPPVERIDQIVSAEEPLAVKASPGSRLWVRGDGGEWTEGRRLARMSVLRGPGGYLAWQGGGQDLTVPTSMMRSTDLTGWDEVALPEPLTQGNDAFAGISVFALEDEWVLIPSAVKLPDTIYTSVDGLDWQEAPRPPRMDYEDMVSWVARVGDQAQAVGVAMAPADDLPSPTSLWTWELGQPAGEPETLGQVISAPVAFDDGYVAFGSGTFGSGDTDLTWWRFDPAERQ
jgi:hypothetical protein